MRNFDKPPIGVLLVNLGTPDSPKVPDVRKYLREFLMDGRVIDVPYFLRFILVQLIIAPFRAPKSAKIYQELWTEQGSPIKIYGQEITKLLQEALGEKYKVVLGMRYQSPGIEKALEEIDVQNLEKLIVLPLFPQYASASTGSVIDKVMGLLRKRQIIPAVDFIQSFFDHPLFIKAFAEIGKRYLDEHHYDHILFSYHGLPERQIRKGDPTKTCLKEAKANKSLEAQPNCCATLHPANQHCYRAQCFATTRLLADRLGLVQGTYSTTFQSRLGSDPWLKPYTDLVIKKLAKEGKKKILTFSPAFVADCLETTIEIGEEYKEIFESMGGEHWQLVESLNLNPIWVECLKEMVIQKSNHLESVKDKSESNSVEAKIL